MAGYFVCSGAAGTGTGLSWVNACVSIPALMTAITSIVGGDIIYVHKTHSYLAGAAITWTLPETGTGTVQVLCVDGGDAAFSNPAAMGTTVGALTTGASESTNGNFAFLVQASSSIGAGLYVHGLKITAGAGASSSSADISAAVNAGRFVWSACELWVNSTNVGAEFFIGSTNETVGLQSQWLDCIFRFGATGQSVNITGGVHQFYNCSIHASGSTPTIFFDPASTGAARVMCAGCDWSNCTNVVAQDGTGPHSFLMSNCTIATPVTGTHAGMAGQTSEFHACAAVDGTNGANILAYYKEDAFGIVQDDQTVYVTSGPAQGTQDDGTATSYSLKMTPSALALPYQPLYTPWVWVKVAATGSKVITMKVADTESALLKDSELFMQVEYMGGGAPANSPQSALEGTYPLVGTYHDVTAAGSDLWDTAQAWTNVIESGAYTLSKTVTLDEQGYIRCRVGLGKDTTNPVYVLPLISVA